MEDSKRGLAKMQPEKVREIARKGGQTISKNREHMREIGKKGAHARWVTARRVENVPND